MQVLQPARDARNVKLGLVLFQRARLLHELRQRARDRHLEDPVDVAGVGEADERLRHKVVRLRETREDGALVEHARLKAHRLDLGLAQRLDRVLLALERDEHHGGRVVEHRLADEREGAKVDAGEALRLELQLLGGGLLLARDAIIIDDRLQRAEHLLEGVFGNVEALELGRRDHVGRARLVLEQRALPKVLALGELHERLAWRLLLGHLDRSLRDNVEGRVHLPLRHHVVALLERDLGEHVREALQLPDRQRLEHLHGAERLDGVGGARLHQDRAERAPVHRPQHPVRRRRHGRRTRL
mmetsp:Transcript_62967/g.172901  ORF Transcript_62967/g.172901 Transcript_62967/m.172901 type:complete len:299 (+) Transcript_62967:869-1765(+)